MAGAGVQEEMGGGGGGRGQNLADLVVGGHGAVSAAACTTADEGHTRGTQWCVRRHLAHAPPGTLLRTPPAASPPSRPLTMSLKPRKLMVVPCFRRTLSWQPRGTFVQASASISANSKTHARMRSCRHTHQPWTDYGPGLGLDPSLPPLS